MQPRWEWLVMELVLYSVSLRCDQFKYYICSLTSINLIQNWPWKTLDQKFCGIRKHCSVKIDYGMHVQCLSDSLEDKKWIKAVGDITQVILEPRRKIHGLIASILMIHCSRRHSTLKTASVWRSCDWYLSDYWCFTLCGYSLLSLCSSSLCRVWNTGCSWNLHSDWWVVWKAGLSENFGVIRFFSF